MLEIIEELGITLGELTGAALVFTGIGGVLYALNKFGFIFIQLFVG